MWKVRSLCRLKSRKAMAKELARYRLGSVGVQEVKWDNRGQGTLNHPVSNRLFCTNKLYIYIYICVSGSLSPRHGASSGCG